MLFWKHEIPVCWQKESRLLKQTYSWKLQATGLFNMYDLLVDTWI